MRCLFIPDSFKGTLSAVEVCKTLTEALNEVYPEATSDSIPVADGGEGTLECFLSVRKGRRYVQNVAGPLPGQRVSAAYALLEDQTAVIEMAQAAGLTLVEGQKDPLGATTYGVGELMDDALKRGAKEIILGLGGSATTDLGCGMAAALGVLFYDEAGKSFVPDGGTLCRVARIDLSPLESRLRHVKVTALCDIKNPLLGPSGAAAVFGPQKGAGLQEIQCLERGLASVAALPERKLKRELCSLPGSGAAGGLGAGAVAFLNATLSSGIETVLRLNAVEKNLSCYDFVVTGEGCFDAQSLQGKVIDGVSSLAKAQGVPVIVIAGGVKDAELPDLQEKGIVAAFSVNRLPEPLSQASVKACRNLKATARQVFSLLKAVQKP